MMNDNNIFLFVFYIGWVSDDLFSDEVKGGMRNETFYIRPAKWRVLWNSLYVRLLVGTNSRNIVTNRVVRDSNRNYRRVAMTVKQLKQQLESLPDDYEVIISNHHAYMVGEYKTDAVEVDNGYKWVNISSEYIFRWNWYQEKWERWYRCHIV